MDRTERFPRICEALASLNALSATIDGEAVVCCPKTGMTLGERLRAKRNGKSERETMRDRLDERDRPAADKKWEMRPPAYASRSHCPINLAQSVPALDAAAEWPAKKSAASAQKPNLDCRGVL